MHSAEDLISVIIPTCNRWEVLRQVLCSLDEQESEGWPFEVIVADDGSADDTPALLARSSFSYPFDYLRQDRRGPAAARNAALRKAAGRIILFLNDDCLAAPDLLARHRKNASPVRPKPRSWVVLPGPRGLSCSLKSERSLIAIIFRMNRSPITKMSALLSLSPAISPCHAPGCSRRAGSTKIFMRPPARISSSATAFTSPACRCATIPKHWPITCISWTLTISLSVRKSLLTGWLFF